MGQGAPNLDVPAREQSEYQRLRAQAVIWQGATEALLDRTGLGRGKSCLDVGSGRVRSCG